MAKTSNKKRTPAHPSRPGAKKTPSTTTPAPTLVKPLARNGPITDGYHVQRPGHLHGGIDVAVPLGTKCFAPADGTIKVWPGLFGTGGIMVQFIFGSSIGSIKAGTVIGWGHVPSALKTGKVKAGDHVANSGTAGTGPHVHFVQRQDANAPDGSVDPNKLFKALMKGQAPGGSTANQPTPSTSSTTTSVGTSAAGAFSTFLELPGIFDQARSEMLAGKKSLMNDSPLLPFVEQLCKASLRNFQSMPNGNFFAFFPDYFGGLSHRTAYWNIEDIEILDGQIELSDDALATHVYIVGDTSPSFGTIDITDEIMTSGVVSIFDAFSSDFISGLKAAPTTADAPSSTSPSVPSGVFEGIAKITDKANALAFLTKYGARPYREEAPMIRNPFFELFLAYQTFMLMWSQQFLTTFTFTFMPELYPGGIVAFPDHGIQCYIAEVAHTFDYEVGFTTQANLMAPAALPNSGKENVHDGLVRAFTLGNDLPFDPFANANPTGTGDKAATGKRPKASGKG